MPPDPLPGDARLLALQRALMATAFRPAPEPLLDPAGIARAQGLGPGDQTAFHQWAARLRVYRRFVRADLLGPVARAFPVIRALLQREGAWEACAGAFIAAGPVRSPHYRDVPAAFLGWLDSSGWGRDRWPCLLELAHFELLESLVARAPDHVSIAGLSTRPGPGDLVVLHPATRLVAYAHGVHDADPMEPFPSVGPVHLMAWRDAMEAPRISVLTPATSALLVRAQGTPIGQSARELGIGDLAQALDLLATFREDGALLGFRPGAGGCRQEPAIMMEGC
jgi:hypothetical protein